MNCINNHLPLETLTYIFYFLDTTSCIRNKLVCKTWRNYSSRHCGYLHVKSSSPSFTAYQNRGDRVVEEEVVFISVKAQEICGLDHLNDGSSRHINIDANRTRGHLPNPIVLSGESKVLTYQSQNLRQSVISKSTTGSHHRSMDITRLSPHEITIAIRFEHLFKCSEQYNYIASLDLESIRIHFVSDRNQFPISKSITIKKAIQVLDLSSLCRLKQLSIRGCSNINSLRIPPCLEGLDATACSLLKEISFGTDLGSITSSLKALNLNGCRSLAKIQFFRNAIAEVEELDMTSVSFMPKTSISYALAGANKLKNVSMRYIADKKIICGLTESRAIGQSLRLIDISFSSVTDASVEQLVNHAMNLERCNLRGIKSISGNCYNQVPIFISMRRNTTNNNNNEHIPMFSVASNNDFEDQKQKKRKGDNIFYFSQQP